MNDTPSSGPVQPEVSLYDRINWSSKVNQGARLNFHTNLHVETKIGIVILTGLIGITVIGLLAAAPLFKCLTEFSASTKNIFRKDVKKTEQVAQKTFRKSNTPNLHIPDDKEAQILEHKTPDNLRPPDNQHTPPKSHDAVASEIFNIAEHLWISNDQDPVKYLLAIRKKFRDDDLSLQNLSDEWLNRFFTNSHLRLALVSYARANDLKNILNKHLIFIANEIFINKDKYTAEAITFADENNANKSLDEINYLIALRLFEIINKIFHTEGRSLSEILNNEEALNIFESSGRLKLVLYIYVQMKTKDQTNVEDDQEDLKQKRIADAMHLAEIDAEKGQGHVTALGLNMYAHDQNQLRLKVKKLLFKISGDKGSNADPELQRKANRVLNLIRDGVYENYIEKLNKLRGKPIPVLNPTKEYPPENQPKTDIDNKANKPAKEPDDLD